MTNKIIKGAFCPSCKKKLFRRNVKRNKPTICGSCGFVVKDPYQIFTTKTKYLKNQNN